MNKKQIVSKITRKLPDLSKTQANQIIDMFFDEITTALVNGQKVRIVGFGNFVVKKRKGRTGRNPQTGEKITIPPHTSATFIPGINLKASVRKDLN